MSLRTLLQIKVGEYNLVDDIIKMKKDLERRDTFKASLDLIKNMECYGFDKDSYCDFEAVEFRFIDNKQFCLLIKIGQDFTETYYRSYNLEKELKGWYGDISNMKENIDNYGMENITFHKKGLKLI